MAETEPDDRADDDRNLADPFDRSSPNYRAFYQPGSRTDLEFRLSRKLILTARRWVNLIDTTLGATTGQTRARWQTLFAIAFARPPVTTMSLSSDRNVRWPTLVRTLSALEKEGLISRRDNPGDGRSRIIELTPAGQAMLAKIQPVIDSTRGEVVSAFSDAELVQMTDLLDMVLGGILRQTSASEAADEADGS
jgi:MarR family transcriptional regulator, transcriptional regulator for hemolysin